MRKVRLSQFLGNQGGVILSVSREEADLLAAENATAIAEGVNDTAEMERSAEIADNLEDVAAIADTIPEATESDLAFVDTNVSMATAGTDVSSDEVIPTLEAMKGGKIDTERLHATVEGIRASISEKAIEMGHKASTIFSNAGKQAGVVINDLNEVNKKGGTFNGQLELSSSLAKAIAVGGKVPSTGAELLKALKGQLDQTKVLTDQYVPALLASGDAWHSVFKQKHDGTTINGSACQAAAAKCDFAKFNSVLKTSPAHDERYSNDRDLSVGAAPAVLGNKQLYVVTPKIPSNPVIDFAESYMVLQSLDDGLTSKSITIANEAELQQIISTASELARYTQQHAQNTSQRLEKLADELDDVHRIWGGWLRAISVGSSAAMGAVGGAAGGAVGATLAGGSAAVGAVVGGVVGSSVYGGIAAASAWAYGKIYDYSKGEVHRGLVEVFNSYGKKTFHPMATVAQHNLDTAKAILALAATAYK